MNNSKTLSRLPRHAELDYIPLDERLTLLRNRAQQETAYSVRLVDTLAAIVAVLAVLATLVFIALFAMSLTDETWPEARLLFSSFGLVCAAAACYAVHVLINSRTLFERSYNRCSQTLIRANLPLYVVHQGYWQQIRDGINRYAWLFLETPRKRSHYASLEDHLNFCACHLPNLLIVAKGKRLTFFNLGYGQQSYNLKDIDKRRGLFFTSIGLVVAFSGYAFVPALVWIHALTRYIISRATLAAICDYLRNEPKADPGPPVITDQDA